MVRVRAPALPATLPWLNCSAPLSLKALRGRPVILHFWTYGCVNCLHALADLRWLEQRYGAQLGIIGVHTPKFDREQRVEAVAQAAQRYGIAHPVVADGERYLWDQYAVRAWPTLVLIDPEGYVVATLAGEGHRQRLELWLESLAVGSGTVMLPPLPPPTPLRFPSQVAADGAGERLCIADSGYHRLVMVTIAGQQVTTLGSGPGWRDGPWSEAQFHSPQGIVWDPQRPRLYVADAGNHCIRCVDWASQRVSTLAGTGRQALGLKPQSGLARQVALNSPWDVQVLGDGVYIAMADSHQIWRLDLAAATVTALLGTGGEGCVDGGAEAAFAQPSGLATDGQDLYVADSESSTLRRLRLSPAAMVETLCGSGTLFGFGDRNGRGQQVRLQHCSGLAYGAGALWVADTYNHQIKRVDPATGECRWLAGRAEPGRADGVGAEARFHEPTGLACSRGALYVADTNNHAIRRVDLTSAQVSTLALPGLCAPHLCLP